MSNGNDLWTLGIQLNRKVGERVYSSLRFYVPTNNETKPLLEKLQIEGGDHTKIHYRAKILNHGSRIIIDQVQPEKAAKPSLKLAERADEIITIVAQMGGTTTWPMVREKLGRPPESMPGPLLVQALKERGLQSLKNPKTSTMTWKLIDREKLNGWTHPKDK